jgi:hypothetical protein
MPVVTPAQPRFTLDDDGQTLRFTIPSRKHWFTLLFFFPWLIVWAPVECLIIGLVIGGILSIAATVVTGQALPASTSDAAGFGIGGALFLLIWLALWTAGGTSAAYLFLWELAGRETIEVGPGSIKLSRRIFRFGAPKEYLAEHIRDLRAHAPQSYGESPLRTGLWASAYSTLSFDYGARTIHLANGTDEAEAKLILAEIAKRYPHYCQ